MLFLRTKFEQNTSQHFSTDPIVLSIDWFGVNRSIVIDVVHNYIIIGAVDICVCVQFLSSAGG